jgi:hypothetical protein
MASEKPKDNGNGAAQRRPLNPVIASTAARAHLECTGGPEKGQTLRVAPGVTLIGRDASCDVILSETVVSRQHARIERRGDQWVLKNLSSNGTLMNKKSIDEAALADGDEIRIGAKTRLRFVVESVAILAAGRPQFRRRTSAEPPEGAAGEEAGAGAEDQELEAKPSLFRRRRGLFIGLAAYMAVLLAVGVYLFFRHGPEVMGGRDVPILGLDDAVRPGPGQQPLRIIREDMPRGIWVEGRLSQPVLVPAEDLQSGKAVRITGIRKALDVRFQLEVNPILAKQCEKQAIELYRVRYLPGKEAALFGAVRLFQRALAYYGGRGYFGDPAVDKVYRDALKELTDFIYREYSNAIIYEEAGSYKQANETYKRILTVMPDRENNPVFDNIARRMADLARRHSDAL